ncbi:hypothetical protein CEXT_733291 [Caerostris extrusa]|uniref:Uncharacterized protein n=1 Tax=Caerostris extrusa TaxID=172846 RepID=A0AAV4P0L0_CAEEX|nr:hypothetical protein CEXT_733291 [Caerostris extrusa]
MKLNFSDSRIGKKVAYTLATSDALKLKIFTSVIKYASHKCMISTLIVSTHLVEEEESKDGRIACRQVGVAHLDPVAVCGWGVRTQRHCPIIPRRRAETKKLSVRSPSILPIKYSAVISVKLFFQSYITIDLELFCHLTENGKRDYQWFENQISFDSWYRGNSLHPSLERMDWTTHKKLVPQVWMELGNTNPHIVTGQFAMSKDSLFTKGMADNLLNGK